MNRPPSYEDGPRATDIVSRALLALYRLGIDRREAQFRSAHEQGCCYLCHIPYFNAHANCPCPHWFLMGGSLEGRIQPIFETYGLSDVLHFLLLHLRAGTGAWRPYRQLSDLSTPSTIGIGLRLRTRQWSFEMPLEASDGLATVVVRCPRRFKEDLVAKATAQAQDLEVLVALACLARQCSLRLPDHDDRCSPALLPRRPGILC
jgi:hypothetical protein